MAELQKLDQNSTSLFLLLSLFSLQLFLCSASSDNYLVDCGAINTSTSFGNRIFQTDSNLEFFSLSATSSTSVKNDSPSPGSSPLYQTARIFNQPSSYKFPIREKGTHFIRLHFFAFSSEKYNRFLSFSTQNYKLSSAVFDVSALGLSLLKDFSVSESDRTDPVREFVINVDEDTFDLTFKPFQNSFAFVNAIEVFSAPTGLFPSAVKCVSPKGFKNFNKLTKQRLELVQRLNVGGPLIPPANDTLGRNWNLDDGYLLLNDSAKSVSFTGTLNYKSGLSSMEIAPQSVYSTARKMTNLNLAYQRFNITWMFQVTPDFRYFIRMHFCDFNSTSPSELYFNVYINYQLAEKNLQPGSVTNQRLATPFYKDFVADPDKFGSLRVSIGPSDMMSLSKQNAILNGLEIMQIRASNSTPRFNKKALILILSVLGGFACIGLLVFVVFLLAKRRRKPVGHKEATTEWRPVTGTTHSHGTNLTNGTPSPRLNLGLQISFDDLKFATDNFDEKCVLGFGGFGKVYKGVLRDGTKVAVKRAVSGSGQGLSEFHAEIIILSRIRHRHLVSLIGYCEEQSEMILVYEFVEKGTLKMHLCGPGFPCLSWQQRLEICIGAARGLHYLHTGSSPGIIHRDVKSSNILLDEDYFAKVSDFGLSKFGPTFSQTHVSTDVKGSFGYLDPEYYKSNQLTDKSDIYSFGVVLLEVLCARSVIDTTLSGREQNLAEWGMKCHKRGKLEKIVDPRLKGQINLNSLRKFGETAEKCLAEHGSERPTMGEVLWNLEYVLQLHLTATPKEADEDSNVGVAEVVVPNVGQAPSSYVSIHGVDASATSNEEWELGSSKVFSQLKINEGR